MFDQFSSDFDKNSLEPNSLNFALNQVQLKLQTFFATSTASEQLNQVFDVTDQNASNFLIANGKNGIFDIPQLQILPDIAMNGAQAAFSLAKDTIYLADSLVGGSTLDIEKVIIEELGHKFDTLLNPGGDTPGDEGELFKDIVLGLPLSQPELLRIQTENDFGTVVVDNQVISVEQAHKNSTDATGDGKGDAIVVNNDGVYVRRSNGSQFLPNEKWTEIGYLGSKAAGFGDVTGDGKADAIVSNNDGVYVRRSNGSKFLPNEKWTDIGYWGSKGTWFGDVALTGTSSTPPPPVGKYQLPYPDGKTYQVTQGNNGGTSHYDQWNRYAWDFNMLEGSTVVATRGGKVVSLYEGSQTKLSSLNGWSQYTNYVLIDHGDGTSALYLHLKYNGVLPNVGDSVSQNQPIAQSGKTGYILGIPGDHLHYSVQKTPSNIPAGGFSNKSGNYVTESLPSSFSDPGVLSKNSNGVPTYPNNYTS
ncbi:peptidoglycan DD-metalloendopeptidase family protein [Planktothrix agardhii]|uniref:peptidoglycan DD-metalloendopeptidase family protein n=1 Tax=Planktothrix agardhii TaxID=1160 RepID=UPI002874CA33|nr:peptidoglycan DD-metalloendopeptidase family protein [Planktothrix agardhii]MDS1347671.1 peptidoglycan DD-metalloendopeptidase family protein [Planktothrix agardhii NRERC-751]